MGLPSSFTGSETPLESQHLQTIKSCKPWRKTSSWLHMHPYGRRRSEQSVPGPQQNHWGYIKHTGLHDMKQHAMGWASLSTVLLLRECAFQEERQGPWGHKAWLMAEKWLFPTHENKVFSLLHLLLPSIVPCFQQCGTEILSFQHTAEGEWLPKPGRAVLLHRGRSQPGFSLPHKASSEVCRWRDTDKCRYACLGLQGRSRKPSEQALHFGCGTWWPHRGKPPCLLCTMSDLCPLAPLQKRQTCPWLGRGSWWKSRPSGLSFFTALFWMTFLAWDQGLIQLYPSES